VAKSKRNPCDQVENASSVMAAIATEVENPMRLSTYLVALSGQLLLFLLASHPAKAFDLTGAWATDENVCEKIFAKSEKAVTFKRNSSIYGGGFVVEGSVIRGPGAKCRIKARKQDGAVIHLMASCSTAVLVDTIQLSFRVIDDNKIMRLFPGMEGVEVAYSRCAF
jgi:hypothetical protein